MNLFEDLGGAFRGCDPNPNSPALYKQNMQVNKYVHVYVIIIIIIHVYYVIIIHVYVIIIHV